MRILTCFLLVVATGSADTIIMNSYTSLNDGSMFTSGTTYYATFQMNAGDASSSLAAISNIVLDSGSALPPMSTDEDFGLYSVGPDPGSTDGIFQLGGTLGLTLTAGSGFSLYTQQFVAGGVFQFDVSLSGTFDGGTPDSFSFQLYDASLSTLLYEQDLAVLDTDTTPTPEPPASLLTLAGVALLGLVGARKNR